jgi:hypothetical protein
VPNPSAGAAFAHPCMGLLVKQVVACHFILSDPSLSKSSFLVRPQNRFFVPTMRGASDAARRRCQGWPRSCSLRMPQPSRCMPACGESKSVATAGGGAKRPLQRRARRHADPGRDRAAHAWPARGSGRSHRVKPVSIRGEPAVCVASLASQPCIRWAFREATTMMQSCASAAGSGAAAPIYKSGTKARVGIGAPPPRIVRATRNRPTAVGRQAFKVLQSSLAGGTRVHRRPFRSPPASARRRPAIRRSSRSATARPGSCAPAPRSSSCG